MSTFDERLSARLEALDAAMPESPSPAIPSASRDRRPRHRRVAVLLAAAAVALFGVAGVTVLANPLPPDPATEARNAADEARVSDALAALLDGRCLSAAEATEQFREGLDELGLKNWSIRDDGRTAKSPCVGAAVSGETQEVWLMPNQGGPLAEELDELEARLMRDCLGRDEAVAALRTILTTHAIADPAIQVTPVFQMPADGTEAYLEHVAKGCYVYGHAQFDQEGAYTWYISGP